MCCQCVTCHTAGEIVPPAVPQLQPAALIAASIQKQHSCCQYFPFCTAGEILPQAVCRSYGLQVGSYSALLVRLLMGLSAPISWPISKLLDWILGEERSVSDTDS
jgi:CBS domain containing-hemolysin-like protein